MAGDGDTIARLVAEADAASDRADWAAANALAQQILALEPDNADAAALHALAERRSNSRTEAGGAGDRAASKPAASTTPLPESIGNGRYRVKSLLGEGARKTVYLADDTTLDREVAAALIKTDGLDEVGRQRVTREAKTMARLGSHANVVAVYDMLVEQERPCLVLEYLPGGDLAQLLASRDQHRLPAAEVLAIAGDVARGLAFAHEHGVIHRDLKPGNVWLADDGAAKIGDFGLALTSGRSRLTAESAIVGTAAYLAPEQATGGELSPRSDLYALGCLLYELVTGRPPFLSDDDIAIIGQHIHTAPVAPSWHAADCPEPLEALILRLLAKDPAQRPASAADVAAALASIQPVTDGQADAAGASAKAGDGRRRSSLDAVASGIFVGRRRELDRLEHALEAALSGAGGMVALVGEPGIGKTRTAAELATYAGLRGAQVLWGRSLEDEGSPPFWPWIQALRTYVREREPDVLRSELGSGAGVVSELLSDVTERLPDVEPPAEVADPDSARFRLFDAISTFLTAAARTRPLVVVLDDLHWADQPTLDLMAFLAPEIRRSRVLLVGAYRDVELNRKHPLQQTLAELSRAQLFERVPLRGLAQEDVARFIELAANVTPPASLVATVFGHTEGNPLFVAEVVRLLVQEGELETAQMAEQVRWSIRIPEGVREVIGRRLDRLSDHTQQLLTQAALLGRGFTLAQLQATTDDAGEEQLLVMLDELLAARMIDERQDTAGNYEFTHALIRETLLEELSITRRARMHAATATALEQLYGEQADDHAEELARHFANAETVLGTERLVHYSKLAGDQAAARYAYQEAEQHYSRALESAQGREDAFEAEVRWGFARARQILGLMDGEVAAHYERAFDIFVGLGDTQAAVRIPDSYGLLPPAQSVPALAALTERAIALVGDDANRRARLLATFALETRDDERARDAVQEARSLARRLGNDETMARVSIAVVALSSFDIEVTGLDVEQVVEHARKAGDKYTEIAAIYVQGRREYAFGDPRVASRLGQRALDAADRLRDVSWQLLTLMECQIAAMARGNWDEARSWSDRGLAITPQRTRAPVLCRRMLLELETGTEAASAFRNQFIAAIDERQRGQIAPALALAARIAGDHEHLDLATRMATATLAAADISTRNRVLSHVTLGLVAVLRGDARGAEAALAGIGDWRASLPSPFCPLVLDRARGLLAATAGDHEAAVAYLRRAIDYCRRTGCGPEQAWAGCDLADVLQERDAGASEVRTLLHDARLIAEPLGMTPLVARIDERVQRLDAVVTYPDSLTGREVEVLRLVAAGHSDKEIGTALGIATKTASNHVRNILAKTGCISRAAAATYAATNGLLAAED